MLSKKKVEKILRKKNIVKNCIKLNKLEQSKKEQLLRTKKSFGSKNFSVYYDRGPTAVQVLPKV